MLVIPAKWSWGMTTGRTALWRGSPTTVPQDRTLFGMQPHDVYVAWFMCFHRFHGSFVLRHACYGQLSKAQSGEMGPDHGRFEQGMLKRT